MDVDGTIIRTPYDLDSYLEYDFDWMHQVAKCISETPEAMIDMPDEIRRDITIQDHISFLKEYRRVDKDSCLSPLFKAHRIVMGWKDGGISSRIRHYIEPLLLTGVTFQVIAEDLGGERLPAGVVQLYERLYFNVREPDGSPGKSSFIRMRASIPPTGLDANTPADVIWKAVGMRLGYVGLVTLWQMPANASAKVDDNILMDETRRAAQSMQINNLMRGTMNNFDITGNLNHHVDYKRMQHDTGKASGDESEIVLYELLKKFAPQKLAAAKDVDKDAETTKVMQARLLAQANVAGQGIMDRGAMAGHAAIHDSISRSFEKKGLVEGG